MYAVPFRIDQNLIKRSPDTHTASQLSLREVQRRSNLWIHLKRRDRHLPAGRRHLRCLAMTNISSLMRMCGVHRFH